VACVEVVRSPTQVAGGTEIQFTPETRWLACRADGARRGSAAWMRFYVATGDTRRDGSAEWVRFELDR
jgi:hypothetical protein